MPLYGSDITATISAGTATLSDAEPNGVTLTLGLPPGATGASPALLLSNSALGPDMTLDTVGPATLGVDGYDTNYGTVNVAPSGDAQTAAARVALNVNIGSGSQLNQEGTIAVFSPQTVGYSGDNLSFTGSGTLNNDGQIDLRPGSTTYFAGSAGSPQITGSGTITVDHANATLSGAASTQMVDLLGGTLTTYATGALAATIKDWNNDGSVAVDPFVRSVQFNQTSDAGGDLQLFGAAGQVGDLNLLGSYATSDFSVNQNKSGFEVISVSGHAPPSA